MFLDRKPDTHEHLPHIVRIKSGQTLNARLAGNPLRVFTHFLDGRTYPCIRSAVPDCPLCEHVANPRYYAYWPISGSTGIQAAVELTELAELQLLEILPAHGQTFGQLLTFHRPPGRRNNPVQVSLPMALPSDEENRKKALRPVPAEKVQRTLFRLWSLPPQKDLESIDQYLQRMYGILACRYLSLATPRHATG